MQLRTLSLGERLVNAVSQKGLCPRCKQIVPVVWTEEGWWAMGPHNDIDGGLLGPCPGIGHECVKLINRVDIYA